MGTPSAPRGSSLQRERDLIFVTVGSQMPFDRLISAMDAWAGCNPDVKVFAQIGKSTLTPTHMEHCESLSPSEFRRKVTDCSLLVAHAGMGSVLTGLEFSKPMVLMPRLGSLRETRNDHQVATSRWLTQKPGIYIANAETDIPDSISRALSKPASNCSQESPSHENQLVEYLRLYFSK